MANVFRDGAEFQDTIFWSATSGTIQISTSTGVRSGNACYKLTDNNAYVQKNLLNVTEAFFRFSLYLDGGNPVDSFFQWFGSDGQMGSLRRASSTKYIEIYTNDWKATGNIAIVSGVMYLIEVHITIHDTTGIISVKVDGIPDADFSGDTRPYSGSNMTYIRIINANSNTPLYIDDLAMNDTTGSEDNSWCGDGKMVVLFPNANGDVSQLMGSDGNQVDNYLLVDEKPHDTDATYNQSSTLDEYDLYHLTPCGLSEVTILRIYPEARAKDTVAEGGLASLPISISGAGVYEGTDRSLLTSYSRILGSGAGYTLNPYTGLPWETSELDALQVGFKVRS